MRNITNGIGAGFVLLLFNSAVSACPWCRAQVRNGVYNEDFFVTFFMLLLPLVILTAIGFGLYHADKIVHKFKREIK